MSSGTSGLKGQFFLIGAVFICALLFFGISPVIKITNAPAEDMSILGENLQRELPHALNIGINSSEPLNTLYNFTGFSRDTVMSRGIDIDAMWVIFIPEDGSMNVSAGNFMDSAKTFGINVSGTHTDIYVAIDAVNSSVFPVSGPTFDVTVTFDSDVTQATLLTNKTGMYSVIALERGENTVRKEILA